MPHEYGTLHSNNVGPTSKLAIWYELFLTWCILKMFCKFSANVLQMLLSVQKLLHNLYHKFQSQDSRHGIQNCIPCTRLYACRWMKTNRILEACIICFCMTGWPPWQSVLRLSKSRHGTNYCSKGWLGHLQIGSDHTNHLNYHHDIWWLEKLESILFCIEGMDNFSVETRDDYLWSFSGLSMRPLYTNSLWCD